MAGEVGGKIKVEHSELVDIQLRQKLSDDLASQVFEVQHVFNLVVGDFTSYIQGLLVKYKVANPEKAIISKINAKDGELEYEYRKEADNN